MVITDEMITAVLDANPLAESEEGAEEGITDFLDEISTPDGLAIVLNNLDYFNY